MSKLLLTACLLFSLISHSQNNQYEKAWKSLNENKRVEAATQLAEAVKDPQTFNDAYISNIYLASYNGKENAIDDFDKSFYNKSENPYPYIYALWFNGAVAGAYGKKSYDRQVKLLEHIIGDNKAHGTLVASANYQKGFHHLFSNQFSKAEKNFGAVGNIKNWQFAGPFENLSQSGFFKNYGPLDNPKPDALFKSITNADVKWFTPTAECKEGWTPVCYQYNHPTAVVYAQNFVTSPVDQTIYCNIGASGSVKVWINDELVISEAKERVTELDVYSVKYDLKKGVNRVLIQLGFTQYSYPNFSLRFTDDKFRAIENITGSSVYAAYPKMTGTNKKHIPEPHFAEAFFQEKITKQPNNMLNYLLLADVFLRNQKVVEARNIVTAAIEKAPDNCMLKMKMIEVLIKEDNRTLMLEELEKIKQTDPESLTVMDTEIKELFNNEKYEDGAVALAKRIEVHGEDLTTASYKILLLVNEKKYDEMIKEAEIVFNKYPDNTQFLQTMYAIKKEVYKDHKGAMGVYETFMKNNYDYNTYEKYADLLAESGESGKALKIKTDLANSFPYSPEGYSRLSKYFYSAKEYNKAEDQLKKALDLSPYNEYYWEQMGDIRNEQKNVTAALEAYNLSLKFNPNQYTIISKIRKLKGQTEITKLLPEADIQKIIDQDEPAKGKNTDYGFYYILDQKDVVMHPGGATEQYFTTLIRITNEKGVDRYKETSIEFGNSQNLLVEKAEIIKKNRSKIEGERNENEIVFTNLQVGDVVFLKYRLQSFVYGRFGKEYWDSYCFNGQVYSSLVKYTLLVPSELGVKYSFSNSTIKPVVSEVENFKKYTWEQSKAEPLKDEPLMPVLADVGAILHISTIPAWTEIANWYKDVCNNKEDEDFEIIALFNKLFPAGQKSMTQTQKAKIIYDYIQSNIRYSSVSFRQSAYVPQRGSTTLSTRLGDCKDLSSLFVTLAQMAGINAQMVLVETRDNGQQQLVMPSMEFNHCIVRTVLDGKNYYVEMTDNYLPFGSLPNNLIGAQILEIPSKNISNTPELKLLVSPNRTKDMVTRIVEIRPVESNLKFAVKTVMTGALSSSIRSSYVNLDEEHQMETLEKVVAGRYKNNVKLESIGFKRLDKLDDSVEYNYSFKVKNEISEIGSLKTFRIIYPDVVASLDNFTAETRTTPIEYYRYEDADSYETVVTIIAPKGLKFVELPASETLTFKNIKFSIHYDLKAPDKLVVTRKFYNQRENIDAADYPAFKAFFEKIVKAEQKFIAYK